MSNWFISAAPLENGWYWRKDIEDCSDEDKHIIEVYNGLMYDTMPMTTYGAPLVIFENSDFQDYWFSGPIEIPE